MAETNMGSERQRKVDWGFRMKVGNYLGTSILIRADLRLVGIIWKLGEGLMVGNVVQTLKIAIVRVKAKVISGDRESLIRDTKCVKNEATHSI